MLSSRASLGQGWFLDLRPAGGRRVPAPGLGWDSLLTLVDVALQAPALLRSDTATCQGGKPGGAPLLHSISNVPSLAWPGLTILISYRQSVTGFHTNIHIHAL